MFSDLLLSDGSPNPRGLVEQLGLYRLLQADQPNNFSFAWHQLSSATVVHAQPQPTSVMPRWYVWRDGVHVNVLFGGTATAEQWLLNLAGATGIPYRSGAKVHWYFYAEFINVVLPVLLAQITAIGSANIRLHLFGHSLGGALAAMAYLHLRQTIPTDRIECLTVGQPRVATSGLPEAMTSYARVAFALDGVAHVPTPDSNILYSTAGLFSADSLDWQHYGNGYSMNLPGAFVPYANIYTTSGVQALGVIPLAGYWHNSSTYWQYAGASPGVMASLFIDAPQFQPLAQAAFNGSPNDGPGFDFPPTDQGTGDLIMKTNFTQAAPPAPSGISRFALVNVVPPGQALTVINPDDVFPDLFPSVPGPFFTESGGDSVALWKVSIKYVFRKRTWSEVFFCDAATVADALKFDSTNIAPLLAFRPPGTTIEYIRASDVLNPRLGDVKDIMSAASIVPGVTNRPDVIATGALVRCKNAANRGSERIIRGWQDELIQEDENGNILPSTVGAVNAYLAAYLAALNTQPKWGLAGITLRTQNPPNYYPITMITRVSSDAVRLTLSAADFAALGLTTNNRFVSISGARDRNLLGIRGEYFVQSFTTPDIVVKYNIPGGLASYEPTSLFVRRIQYSVVEYTQFVFREWRTRQTADPIDRVRGRGPKVQTRTA